MNNLDRFRIASIESAQARDGESAQARDGEGAQARSSRSRTSLWGSLGRVTTADCASRWSLAALILIASTGCAGLQRWPWGTTQRWPGPMEPLSDPLPLGDKALYPPGSEEVLVVRHADPVQVRPAGLSSSFPLSFYKKSIRVNSGSAVYSAPGGKIEVLWPEGTSVVLTGRSAGLVGSPSRGESSFVFRQLDRSIVVFSSEDHVELIGGALLSGHTGPFILDHLRADILRVKNQSKAAGQIAFREEVFILDPGQVIDLPLLSAGGRPAPSDAGLQEVRGPGFSVRYSGEVDVIDRSAVVHLRARGEHEIQALGVEVRMDRDEEVRFSGLQSPGEAAQEEPRRSPQPESAATSPARPGIPPPNDVTVPDRTPRRP